LDDVIRRIRDLFQPTFEGARNVIDILLVTYLIYRFLLIVRSTRAWRILLGIAIFVLLLVLTRIAELRTLNFVLDKATLLGPVALVILFLPELRQALEGFGNLGGLSETTQTRAESVGAAAVEEIIAAVSEMAGQQTGALIVIERLDRLDQISANGVPLHADISAALLGSLFYEGNPLHDGAVLVRGNKILAAACRLPLSESAYMVKHAHMRHRAGLGVTEQYDCLAIIVSEERGTISYGVGGSLTKLGDLNELRERLRIDLLEREQPPEPKPRRRNKNGKENIPA